MVTIMVSVLEGAMDNRCTTLVYITTIIIEIIEKGRIMITTIAKEGTITKNGGENWKGGHICCRHYWVGTIPEERVEEYFIPEGVVGAKTTIILRGVCWVVPELWTMTRALR